VGLLAERFGPDNIDVDYFPGKGELREIKMRLLRWFERGFPFTFMLHAKEWGRPRIRVLIWREDYTAQAESLRKWAACVNASAGPLIDEDFTPIRGWGWHRIFREEEHPESAVVDEMVFDEGTAKAAVEAVSALVETLRPHVGGRQQDRPGPPTQHLHKLCRGHKWLGSGRRNCLRGVRQY